MLVPAGEFITGTLTLKSHVDLHLLQGAFLLGSHNLEDYSRGFRTNGIVYCKDAEQVSITGEGTIDALGTHFYDPTQSHT